jgi:hypothetical protein
MVADHQNAEEYNRNEVKEWQDIQDLYAEFAEEKV